MTIIAVDSVPEEWSLSLMMMSFAKHVKTHMKAMKYRSTPKNGKLTCYIQTQDTNLYQDMIALRSAHPKLRFRLLPPHETAFSAKGNPKYISQHLSKLEHVTKMETFLFAHSGIMAGLQRKYMKLFELSQQSDHALLHHMARELFERLRAIVSSEPGACADVPSLYAAYRRAHPGYADLQFVLRCVEQALGSRAPPADELAAQLTQVSTVYCVNGVPHEKLNAVCLQYADKISDKIEEHVRSLEGGLEEGDAQGATHSVRNELRKLIPHLPKITEKVMTKHLIGMDSFCRMTMYCEPTTPPIEVTKQLISKHMGTNITNSREFFNLITFSVPITEYSNILALDGTVLDETGPPYNPASLSRIALKATTLALEQQGFMKAVIDTVLQVIHSRLQNNFDPLDPLFDACDNHIQFISLVKEIQNTFVFDFDACTTIVEVEEAQNPVDGSDSDCTIVEVDEANNFEAERSSLIDREETPIPLYSDTLIVEEDSQTSVEQAANKKSSAVKDGGTNDLSNLIVTGKTYLRDRREIEQLGLMAEVFCDTYCTEEDTINGAVGTDSVEGSPRILSPRVGITDCYIEKEIMNGTDIAVVIEPVDSSVMEQEVAPSAIAVNDTFHPEKNVVFSGLNNAVVGTDEAELVMQQDPINGEKYPASDECDNISMTNELALLSDDWDDIQNEKSTDREELVSSASMEVDDHYSGFKATNCNGNNVTVETANFYNDVDVKFDSDDTANVEMLLATEATTPVDPRKIFHDANKNANYKQDANVASQSMFAQTLNIQTQDVSNLAANSTHEPNEHNSIRDENIEIDDSVKTECEPKEVKIDRIEVRDDDCYIVEAPVDIIVIEDSDSDTRPPNKVVVPKRQVSKRKAKRNQFNRNNSNYNNRNLSDYNNRNYSGYNNRNNTDYNNISSTQFNGFGCDNNYSGCYPSYQFNGYNIPPWPNSSKSHSWSGWKQIFSGHSNFRTSAAKRYTAPLSRSNNSQMMYDVPDGQIRDVSQPSTSKTSAITSTVTTNPKNVNSTLTAQRSNIPSQNATNTSQNSAAGKQKQNISKPSTSATTPNSSVQQQNHLQTLPAKVILAMPNGKNVPLNAINTQTNSDNNLNALYNRIMADCQKIMNQYGVPQPTSSTQQGNGPSGDRPPKRKKKSKGSRRKKAKMDNASENK